MRLAFMTLAIMALVDFNRSDDGKVSAFAPTRTFNHAIPNIRTPKQNGPPSCNTERMSTSKLRLSIPSVNVAGLVDSKSLTQFFLETCISYGVPAVFTIIVIGFAARSIKGNGSDGMGGISGGNVVDALYDDLYTDSSSDKTGIFQMFKGGNKYGKPTLKNLGIPINQYLSITKINDVYDSYAYSLTAATQSKAKAAAQIRSKTFNSALKKAVNSDLTDLTEAEKTDLLNEEREFLKIGGELIDSISNLQKQLTDTVIRDEMKKMDVEVGEIDAHSKNGNVIDATIVKDGEEVQDKPSDKKSDTKKSNKNEEETGLKKMMKSMPGKKSVKAKIIKEIEKQNTELLKLELEFIRAVVEILGASRANGVRAALLGNIDGGGAGVAGGLLSSLQERPLESVLKTVGYSDMNGDTGVGKSLFITDFPGDVTASQVEDLREEVTAIIRTARPGDEALLVLQSGGGTVTGYGLAAAQLLRFKDHGMKLTICVEQVAASGGYMMCCVADKVIASPFAVLGSIGVISDLPNVYERLKKEGIEFQTVTAGKYKRTLTPTKKVTKEDVNKQKDELEQILKLFKGFVAKNRPSLDIDDVATGETWFGEDALAKGLCDEIRTVDSVLSEYVDSGYDVYQVKYDPPPMAGDSLRRLLPLGANKSQSNTNRGIIGAVAKWFVSSVIPSVKNEIMMEIDQSLTSKSASSFDIRNKYMVKDEGDVGNKIKI